MTDKVLFYLRYAYFATEQCLKGGYLFVFNATRDDVAEVGEVAVDVECQPVHRDPAGASDAKGTDFLIPDPDACESFDSSCGDSVFGADKNDNLFQFPQVFVDVCEVAIEVEDRIGDELPRPVVGDVAAPVDLDEFGIDGG